MAVIVSNGKSDLNIKIVEENGEVRLSFNGHSFVRCRTYGTSNHIVEVIDVDTGVVASHGIPALCWRR